MINDFASASQACLAFLRERLGFRSWMVTRTEGEDWIVLSADDEGYGIKAGQVFRWSDTCCSRMVLGQGPNVAPDAREVPVYARSPFGRQFDIGAYIGVPLRRADGSLFGTLCAIDPRPQPSGIVEEQPMLELMAGLLGSLLSAELAGAGALRRAERAETEAMRDPLTHLYNRRGWTMLLNREEERCQRYGHPACVVSIDVDDIQWINETEGDAAGDMLLERAGVALTSLARGSDVVARLDGDEFAMLLMECDIYDGRAMLQRVEATLAHYGVKASLGVAVRQPGYDLNETFALADAEMAAAKRSRKTLN
ncbi:sensor domain-containing diguanylate cyclase [Pseudoduganella sp. LjRoot289]|uniref:GGDEF domain-containing protein n=1 Tax=Pseudoduganella sp. LjRoot289 TaxID=3342314 RepID=UPI003ED00CD7